MPGLPTTEDLAHTARGFAMGAADIVPGVSGGTIALVLGIYERLLAAISSFDGALIGLVAARRWRDAADRIDLRFLVALGGGIVAAVLVLAKLMHYLLEHQQAPTYAAFFGLILASGVLVGRRCRPLGTAAVGGCLLLGAVAAGGAFLIVSYDRTEQALQRAEAEAVASTHGSSDLGYTFCSGAVAICAMILPGVSGSYLLILLGMYHEITGIIKDLPRLAVTGEQLVTLAVFAAGCATGLLLFSRVLRWLLARYEPPTMAVLCGFMVGSLYKVWPWQLDATPSIEEFKHKVFKPYWPEAIDGSVVACIALGAAAFAVVMAVDFVARRQGADEHRDLAAG